MKKKLRFFKKKSVKYVLVFFLTSFFYLPLYYGYAYLTSLPLFFLKKVVVEGASFTSKRALLKELDFTSATSLLTLPLEDVKEKVEKLSWVQGVLLKKQYPSTLFIQLEERVPTALWSENQKLYVVDAAGNIISQEIPLRLRTLPHITGRNAPVHFQNFSKIFSRYPHMHKNVERFSCISERRWNIYFKTGLCVKLPEDATEEALKNLNYFLERKAYADATILDFRLKGQIIARFPKNSVHLVKEKKFYA